MSRLAPMRLIPHPPAFELSRKTTSFESGLLKVSTSFCRFFVDVVPSRRRNARLWMDDQRAFE